MSFVCLWSPHWPTGAGGGDEQEANDRPANDRAVALVPLATTLLTHAPRVHVGATASHCVIWADARGLDALALARTLGALLRDDGIDAPRAGIAATPVAAWVAARHGAADTDGIAHVASGTDARYLAPFPTDVLDIPARVRPLLAAIGVTTLGALAALTRESVEVRLGAEAIALWRLARADDGRRHTLFPPIARTRPHASLEWTDYEVSDPARLLFVINGLLERVCDDLAQTGEGARIVEFAFALANRTTHTHPLRAARPSANRQHWMRLARTALERLSLPAAVTGIAVRAAHVAACEARQGDLFDRGFATEEQAEDALLRIADDQGPVVVTPQNAQHPLIEERTTWAPIDPARGVVRQGGDSGGGAANAALTLQLSPVPRPIVVETTARRDHFAPARYRDATGWHDIVNAAGPDRISGSTWNHARAYAREYFRCVTREGTLVWVFRDARRNRWFLHGWWD